MTSGQSVHHACAEVAESSSGERQRGSHPRCLEGGGLTRAGSPASATPGLQRQVLRARVSWGTVAGDAGSGKPPFVTRTGAAAGHTGHFHEVGFFSSDDEFLELLLPWIAEGKAAGEPVIVGYDSRKSELLRSRLDDPGAVTFLDRNYASPAATIASYSKQFSDHIASGAQQIRIAGEAPHSGNGGRFEGWDRYESVVNIVWGDTPVWGRCLYDAHTTPANVHDFAERVHPFLVTVADGTQPNPRYQEEAEFEAAVDAVEQSPAVVTLVEPSQAEARFAVRAIGRGHLDDETLADLELAVSEAVSNARMHGRPPVSVQAWAAVDRVIVRVRDTGPGTTDRLVGMVPTQNSVFGTGMGLWIAHQLGIDVDLLHDDEGFTVRMRGRRAAVDALGR